ncbi:sporulation integral membrane protein YlbJ [Halothermothrix orenii]|uniref:Sporulation integral membrane protein YlbJ n=1 Tax=Halothermothrix orenii (strain H 168 / OCM 544 / DSM 9562) TaxID=373903 RepID=B8CWV2_HALOH|nr:sporulation integral membrane protein YlbJ [Halothermothrix orenii]ACL69771.1 Sporulation integral membrane protein YlbJ [Halothermothrix orenii H 168]
MHSYNHDKKIVITAIIAVITTILIIIFSENAFNAALEGLEVWWEVVFPSLLPFFIIAEILMGLGVVHFMGALMEPLMRPLFKVPGVGAFAMAMGLASGYPIGAKITAALRRKKLCTKTEAERLVSFTNTADPLFMIGAVAVGMFHRADLGIIIAGAHYISSLIIGFIMRFYRGREQRKNKTEKKRKKNIFIYALEELIEARKNDGRPLGELVGDAVKESVNTLLLIGGFIILFSVITEIIIVTGLITVLSNIISFILHPLGLSSEMVLPMISGFFEITNGSNLASLTQSPMLHKMIVVNAIIAWSGLSVHAQVATMVHGTDINLKPYFLARILQSVIAGAVTIFLFKPFITETEPTMLTVVNNLVPQNGVIISFGFIVLILMISFMLSMILYLLQRIEVIFFHYRE